MSNPASLEQKAQTRSEDRGWTPKPAAARAVRAVQIVLPFLAGWLAIRGLKSFFLGAGEEGFQAVAIWITQAIVVATVVSAIATRLVRRLTPLISLLNMSLVFPDSVPSRFGLALRTGNVKRLLAEPNLRLSNSAQAAAEQAVQLVTYLGKHEPLTRGHTERVRAYADVIGQQMGLSDEELNGLRWGALLHDVGKLAVPAEILNKPGKPTAEEWEILRGHPAAAVPILAPLEDWLGDWLLAAPQHHERFDGTGYPFGISGREISLAGRITAVADAYDVITSRRSYKAPKSAEFAREEMVRSAGTHFDPVVVRALLEAGITQSSYGRRMGWLLEVPGIARMLTTAGQAVATATVAVVVSAAPATSLPVIGDSNSVAAPEGLSFIERTEVDDDESLGAVPPIEEGPAPTIASNSSEQVVAQPTTSAPRSADSLPSESSTSTLLAPSTTTGPQASLPQVSVSTSTTIPGVAQTTTTALTTTTVFTQNTQPPLNTRPPNTTTTTPTTTTTTQAPVDDCVAIHSGETFLPNADLRGCDLSRLVATGLHLADARLDGVDLSGARLTDFNLERANLTGANMAEITLNGGSLRDAAVDGASLTNSSFTHVGFQNADLTGADFTDARFASSSFEGAQLMQATFSGVQIEESDFRSADLRAVDLSRLELRAINFEFALIGRVDFGASNLAGTLFGGAVGVPRDVAEATFGSTTCPDWSFGDVSCW